MPIWILIAWLLANGFTAPPEAVPANGPTPGTQPVKVIRHGGNHAV